MISTTTTVSSNSNPSTYGSAVTLSATVTPGGGGPAMTGNVIFYAGQLALGSAAVTWNGSTGGASLSVSTLPGGSDAITAAYAGDANYSPSRSAALTQTVDPVPPVLTLFASASPAVYGQPVTLTGGAAALSSGLPAPTGTLTFYDGTTALGSAALVPILSSPNGAQAILTEASLAVGSHSLTVHYGGDANYAARTSSPYSLTVNPASTHAALAASVNPSSACQAVTFTATVTAVAPGAGTPTGTVTFTVNGSTVATPSLVNGVASYTTSSLAAGSSTIGANYGGDSNFNSSSASLGQTVNAAVNWVLGAAAAAPAPGQGLLVPFGPAQVSPLAGALLVAVGLDADKHTACGCGCGCADDSCRAGTTPLALAYSSATVDVQPIVLATLASDFCAAVPSTIQAQLTWAGSPQGWVTFGTSGHSAGDVYALPLQVSSPVSASGIYSWGVEVKATVGTTVYDRTASGVLPVAVAGGSAFGAGWSLGGSWSLLIGSAGVAMVDNATGGFHYFTGTGPSYTSPANDQGTLVKNSDGTYTYTSKEQLKTNFDSSGRMTGQTDPHGLSQSLSYSSGLLSTLTQPDGGVATFSYNTSNLLSSVQEPGGRYLTLSYDGSNNLTGVVDAAGGIYTFGYDSSHRLVHEQVGPLNVTYTYSSSNGTLTEVDRGLGTTLSLTAAAAQGLGASTALNASQALAALTDGLSHTTSYALDALGRPTQMQTADGAVQSWARDAAGNPTVYTDQLGRVTSYSYNGSEDLTQLAHPDGTFTTYQYETTFHQVTQLQDALNHYTTYSYDGTTGDQLTRQDSLGHVTTYTWSGGLKQTTTDALGRVTTLGWDSGTRRKLTTTDALGHVTSYGYDSAGNLTTVQDALGHVTTSTYDGNRRQLTKTNAAGGVASYSYDAVGHTLSVTDELARTTSYVYDQRGLQVSLTEAVGTPVQRTVTLAHDAAGNTLSDTDALGEVTSFAYDALNRRVAHIDAYGTGLQRTTTTVYDVAGNTLSTIDPRGVTTSFGYDLMDRLVVRLDGYGTALQRATTRTYDAVGNTRSVTNARGTVTSYGYDANDRQTQLVDAYGTSLQRTTTTVYDAVGKMLSVTSPLGAVTSYGYDALDRQTQLVEAYGSPVQRTTTSLFDAVGRTLAVTNPRGTVTSYGYDALDQLVLRLDGYGTGVQRATTTVYDAVGNTLSVANGLGVVTSLAYDALDRQTAQIDGYGTSLQRATTTVYDLDGNATGRIDALGFVTTYSYDALNRVVVVQDAGGGIATTAYDANSNPVSQVDPLGHTTTFVFDVLNRKTQTIDAQGGTVTLAYDANDNQLSLTDPVGNQTVWVYDALDRKGQEIDPLGYSATYAYDAGDRLASATDRAGQRIASAFDLLNRKTGETWFNAGGTQVGVLTFTYDANDNLLTAVNAAGANTYDYDTLDRLSGVSGPFGTVLTYGYDAADNRVLAQDSFGGVTTRTYDALNRVATVQFGGVGQTPLREDFTYTARDQVAVQARYSDLAGTTKVGSSSFTYDAEGRLGNLQHADGSGNTLANYTNSYDLGSRITAEVLNGGAPTTYSYGATNQLTNDGRVTYTYDLNGNRTMPGYSTGPGNELTSDGTWSYFYDRNGNQVEKMNPNTGEVWSYAYDNRNQLISAEDVSGSVQIQATYVYDARGARVEKDVWIPGSGTTMLRFGYDGEEIWADLGSGNALQTRYLRGDRLLELLARVASAGNAAWILADRIGTVRNVVDNTGTLLDTITYDGYGNIISETGATNSGSYKAFSYRFDSETGLILPDPSHGRFYVPLIGRWLGQDPLGLAPDTDPYRYVANSPTNAIDPFGLAAIVQSVVITNEGEGINKLPSKLGPIVSADAVAYGYKVKVNAKIDACSKIQDLDIKQEIFAVFIAKAGALELYKIVDATHPKIPKAGAPRPTKAEVDKLIKAFKDKKETFQLDVSKATIFDPKSKQVKVGTDSVEYSDAPGYAGKANKGAIPLPPTFVDEQTLYITVRVTAKGTDGKAITAVFRIEQKVTSDKKTYKQAPGFPKVTPKLPNTWTK